MYLITLVIGKAQAWMLEIQDKFKKTPLPMAFHSTHHMVGTVLATSNINYLLAIFLFYLFFKIGLPLTFICLHYFGKKNLHTMRGKIDILWHNSSLHCSHLTGWNRC
jgi:hypothetical protein